VNPVRFLFPDKPGRIVRDRLALQNDRKPWRHIHGRSTQISPHKKAECRHHDDLEGTDLSHQSIFPFEPVLAFPLYPPGHLARIIHDGSLRNRGVAQRDGQAQPERTEAYLKQYAEGLSGEHARR
jgi:hypothetical protein